MEIGRLKMFQNTLRNLPSVVKLLGGAARSLTCGPPSTYSTPPLISVTLIPRYNPVLSEPSLINNVKSILDMPTINKNILDIPYRIIPFEDKNKLTIIEEPEKVIEKQAARLIVIRRRKMKRHKLKKLRIKMKHLWAKVRQRREMRKEKAFQAELMCKVKEAEAFDAKQYAIEKLNRANAVLLPKLWKGKRLPEFVIKDLIAKKNKKEEQMLQDKARRQKMNLNVSDFKFYK